MDRQEAIEFIRRIKPMNDLKEALETLIPELKESEDGRIRRFLIDYFTSYKIGNVATKLNGYRIDDILAYLEKQKELPMPSSTELIKMWQQEKQMLQEKDFRGDEWRIAQNAFMDGVAKGILVKQKEQKPAEWSEEDEKMLNRIINDYENGDEYWFKAQCSTPFRPKINWLKSLRPSWKPSEDEERLINTSISFLKDFADKGYENAVECIDWLKSKLNGNACK